MYVGVPNIFFNTKCVYIRRICLKRGSIGVRTQNICFQEEILQWAELKLTSKNFANKACVSGHSVFIYMGTCKEYFCTTYIWSVRKRDTPFYFTFQDTLFILRRAQTITTQNDVARTLTCFFICTYSMTNVQLRNSFQKDRYVKFLILLAYLYNKRFILIAPRIKRTQQLLSSDSLHIRSILQLNRNFRFSCTYV